MRLLLTLFCLLPLWLSAQQPLPLYKNELGLDPVNWLYGRPGVNLVWKRAVGPVRVSYWLNRKVLRFNGGYTHESSTEAPFAFIRGGDTLATQILSNSRKPQAHAFAGMEWQHSRGRWRLYHGFDIGANYRVYSYTSEHRLSSLSTGDVYSSIVDDVENQILGLRLGAFAGAQFFLSGRWSAGLELNLNAGPDFERSKLWRNGIPQESFGSGDGTVFVLGSRPAPLFYLSWHFGKKQLEGIIPNG